MTRRTGRAPAFDLRAAACRRAKSEPNRSEDEVSEIAQGPIPVSRPGLRRPVSPGGM